MEPRKPYPSDVSLEQFESIRPILERVRKRTKPRKLPGPVARVTYDLEYGSDTLEMHLDAIQPGQRVLLVDDLLATGGTMEATLKLVHQLGGEVIGLSFAVELDFLKGRERFPGLDVYSLLHYDE